PYDNGGLYPTAASTTTKANFEAYASDITQSYDHPTKITVYDSKGNEYSLETVFRKAVKKPGDPNATPPTAAEIEWDWYSYYVGADGKPLEPSPGVGAGTLVFGDDGLLKRTYYYDPAQLSTMLSSSDPNATADLIEVTIDSDGVPRDENGAAVTGKVGADFNKYGAEGSVVPGNPNAEPPTGTTYAPNFIELDFLGYSAGKALGVTKEPIDGVTGFASASTTKGYYQDGYTMGVLENFSVAQDGTITGSYSNGEMIPIAQIALATFQNQQGLLQVGETCFAESVNSGMADIGAPMTGGSGSIIGNTIEMSNVDLSEEFVNLIRAQRGFQASTRVVTTSDQVLEELINMKR
ncbi:MAG: flagellar hook-basal body complex protein, partial [Synergistaceae bacterium]|nr:flagellar hook-basal body complex protein [Synergistaceae bacterium]